MCVHILLSHIPPTHFRFLYHARIQEFSSGRGGGGGGVQVHLTGKNFDVFFFSHQTFLQSVQRRPFKDNYTFPRFQTPEGGQVRIQRGERGGGVGGPDPPGKSQVIWVSKGNKKLDPSWKKLSGPPGKSQVKWVSIGNKQLDPSWKKLPPPTLENVGPLWNLEKWYILLKLTIWLP